MKLVKLGLASNPNPKIFLAQLTSPFIDHRVHLAMAKVLTSASKCVPNLMVCLDVFLRMSFSISLCVGSLVENESGSHPFCLTHLPNLCHSTGPRPFVARTTFIPFDVEFQPIDPIQSIHLSRSIVYSGRSCVCRNAMTLARFRNVAMHLNRKDSSDRCSTISKKSSVKTKKSK